MAKFGVVEANLRRLRELDKEDLTYLVVRNLVGMSHGALNNLVNKNKFNYKSKRDISELIKENRSVLEEWPTVSDLEEIIGLKPYVYRNWYRSENIRPKVGAVKLLCRIRFSPAWFGQVQEEMERYDGEFITTREASNILKMSVAKINSLKIIPLIQPAGKKTTRLYPKAEIIKLKEKLDEVSDPKLLTSEQVADKLDISVKEVLKRIPRTPHPITRHNLYDPSVLKEYKNAVFVSYAPLSKIINDLEGKILDGKSIRKKIDYLFYRGRIPSEKAGSKDSTSYLPIESEIMIIEIYKHMRILQYQGIKLVRLREAAEKTGIEYQQLDSLIRKCGIEYLLTSPKPIKHELNTEHEDGRKVPLKPRIPYVRWVENSARFLTTPVVKALEMHIRKARQEAKRKDKPYDGYWYGRLAESIKAEPKKILSCF